MKKSGLVHRKEAVGVSVILREQDRGGLAVCLRDDPEPGTVCCVIDGPKARAFDERTLVGLPIFFAHVTPVTRVMPSDSVEDILAGDPRQSIRCGVDASDAEFGETESCVSHETSLLLNRTA